MKEMVKISTQGDWRLWAYYFPKREANSLQSPWVDILTISFMSSKYLYNI